MMNEYQQLMDRQQEEYNRFPMFFAFSPEDFDRGLLQIGLSHEASDQVKSIGHGGFIRKADEAQYLAMSRRHYEELQNAISSDSTGTDFIYDMFHAELANHEYSYTGEPEEAIRACGLSKKDFEGNPALKAGLVRAIRQCCE